MKKGEIYMLEQYIRDLLYENDCVVIPGFGAIVANYQSAEIKKAKQVIHPPSKKLAFNAGLRTNDGMLANYVADQENISFANALQKVRGEADHWKKQLNDGEEITLEGIGRFQEDEEGNIVFQAEAKDNFLPEAYGLSDAKLVPVKRAAKSRKKKVVRKSRRKRQSQFMPRVGIGAASVLIATVLMTFLLNINPFISNKKDVSQSEVAQTADFSLDENITSDDANQKKESTVEAKKTVNPVKSTVTNNVEKKEEAGKEPENTGKKRKGLAKFENEKPYHIIGGSFKFADNARELASKARQQGYEVEILKAGNGFHRVSFARYENQALAAKELEKMRNKQNGHDFWLLNTRTGK